MKDAVRRFVIDNFCFGQDPGLGDDDSFLEKGIIDSTGVLELVAFIENTHGIKIENEELIPDNLDSIGRICTFLDARLNQTASPAPESAARAEEIGA